MESGRLSVKLNTIQSIYLMMDDHTLFDPNTDQWPGNEKKFIGVVCMSAGDVNGKQVNITTMDCKSEKIGFQKFSMYTSNGNVRCRGFQFIIMRESHADILEGSTTDGFVMSFTCKQEDKDKITYDESLFCHNSGDNGSVDAFVSLSQLILDQKDQKQEQYVN